MTAVTSTESWGISVPPFGKAYEKSSLAIRVGEVAAAAAERVAVVSADSSITYAELDRRSTVLAHVITAQLGTGTEPIATLFGQDVDGIVVLLAAIKAGRPFTQFDPTAPAARLASMLAASGAPLLFTSARHADAARAAAGTNGRVALLAEALATAENTALPAHDGPHAGPTPPVGDRAVAIFFTSGSTGAPKGVIRGQRMVMCDAWSGCAALGFTPADRVALLLPYSFAAGFEVVLWALCSAATLCLFDPRSAGTAGTLTWLAERRPTTLHMAPSLLSRLLADLPPGRVLDHLRLVTTSTEPVNGRDVAALWPRLSDEAVFANWTGASEIGCLAFNVYGRTSPMPPGALPAGRPVPDREAQIWDEDGTVLGPGQTGEVVIVSDYLASGYLGDPERTAERFGASPDGRRFYRTGDLGKVDDDGFLRLAGRADAAVKIRGYLVEPAEVEATLLVLPDVRAAVATGRPSPSTGEPRLCAYVELVPEASTTIADIRRHLREKLPPWMVPTGILLLDALPRTERGKIDRRALPDIPERAGADRTRARTDPEALLLEVWRQVLGLDDIGVFEEFGELGGDSVVAQQLILEINRNLRVDLPPSVLAAAPTVAALAEKINRSPTATPGATCVRLVGNGSAPLLFCFAGGGGMALSFLRLARRLDGVRTVVGFQARGLEERARADWSVQQHARRHLADLRRVQPRGPYHLVGFSFGGLVAYDIAKRLTAAGELVALLAIVDTRLPFLASGGKVPLFDAEPISGEVSRPEEESRRESRRPRLVPSGYRPTRGTPRWLTELALTGYIRTGTSPYRRFFKQSELLTSFYRIRPYDGRTVLYMAEQDSQADEAAWRRLLRGHTTVHRMPGTHDTMLREPHVAALAESLRDELASASWYLPDWQ